MKLSRNDLVQLLHSQGANATADRVATELQERSTPIAIASCWRRSD